MRNKIRVLLVDDQASFLRGLCTLIEAEPAMEVVGEASDGQLAVLMAAELKPDVMVIDHCMPRLSGLSAIREIRAKGRAPYIILLSAFSNLAADLGALPDGVGVCLPKSRAFNELTQHIRNARIIPPLYVRSTPEHLFIGGTTEIPRIPSSPLHDRRGL